MRAHGLGWGLLSALSVLSVARSLVMEPRSAHPASTMEGEMSLLEREPLPEVNDECRVVKREDIESAIAEQNVVFSPGTTISYTGSEEFSSSTERWNPATPPTFVASITVGSEDDVVKAIRLARSLSIAFLATGTRHGYGTTLGNVKGGLAIDLSKLTGLVVNKSAATLVVGPGTTNGAIVGPVDAAGFQIPTGSCSCVSLIGLTIGAGVGRWSGVYGLVTDSLVSVRLVTQDGTIVEASATKNAELFWGIQGAGANFGIVTSATYKLRSRVGDGQALNGDFLFPTDRASDYFNMLKNLEQPAELSITTFVLFDGGTGLGVPLLGSNWVYHGSEAAGNEAFAPLLALNPMVAAITPMRWTEVTTRAAFGSDAGSCTKGTPRSIYSLNVRRNDDVNTYIEVTNKMVNFFNNTPAGRGSVFISEQFPNQATLAVSSNKTAYPWRDAIANIMIQMAWPDGDTATRTAAQATGKDIRSTLSATSGYTGLSVYINYALGDEKLEEIYGKDKLPRLAKLKKTWDPSNVFRFHHALPTKYP